MHATGPVHHMHVVPRLPPAFESRRLDARPLWLDVSLSSCAPPPPAVWRRRSSGCVLLARHVHVDVRTGPPAAHRLPWREAVMTSR